MNACEKRVLYVAEQAVGGWENFMADNDPEYGPTREELISDARDEVINECPREIHFLGNKRIDRIIEGAVDDYEYATW